MPRANSSKLPSLDYGQLQDTREEESFHGVDVAEIVPDHQVDDFQMDWDTDSLNETSGSDIVHRLKAVNDSVITFIGSACMDRMTDAGVQRMISSQTDSVRQEVMNIWKSGVASICHHRVCNQCGEEIVGTGTCCGDSIKYYRVGGISQLEDIVNEHLDQILEIRGKLKVGEAHDHNLNGELLKTLWQSEDGKLLKISLVGSIDGVSLVGNTGQKIWPVTFLIADLPTGEMQRAHNLVIHGIAEGPTNPSTFFWNRVVDMVYSDIENSITKIRGLRVCFSIVSWVADQPAKRALFGMKHFNSESSCFFGMCKGTLYKSMGPKRSEVRPAEKTDEDARNGVNGFGPIPPKIVEYVYPYDTIIDILHNASEGIYPLIIKEVLGSTRLRSDLFKNNSELHSELCNKVILPSEFDPPTLSNCSEKLTYFRTRFGLAALLNPTLSTEARLTISALMLLLNGLYTNAPSRSNNFYVSLTAAPRWALGASSESYMSTKTHELLSHLPDVMTKFGNVAALSTFCFEHYYKHCLKGFSPQKTKGFTHSALSRVILHSAVRREIRSRRDSSVSIRNFLSVTPSWADVQTIWKDKIPILKRDHRLPGLDGFEFFATLRVSLGSLQSCYKSPQTNKDIFFATNSTGDHCCFKFICFCLSHDQQGVLGQRIRPIRDDEQFPLLQEMMNNMPMPGNTYGYHVLTQFKRYDGIVHGNVTGEMEILDLKALKGVGGTLQSSESSAYYLQLNGACVHH